jgi:hypothetical protein
MQPAPSVGGYTVPVQLQTAGLYEPEYSGANRAHSFFKTTTTLRRVLLVLYNQYFKETTTTHRSTKTKPTTRDLSIESELQAPGLRPIDALMANEMAHEVPQLNKLNKRPSGTGY